MENKIGEELLSKYLDKTATAQERLIVENWYAQQILNNTTSHTEDDFERIKGEIWSGIEVGKQVNNRILPLWIRYAAAVLVFFALIAGFYKHFKPATHQNTYANDVAPGKTGATLTLANGTKIRLGDITVGAVANESGVTITKTSDGALMYEFDDTAAKPNAINSVSTAKGETYCIKLPDQSKVWLNAESSITFTATLLNGGMRRVALNGEAYFEVAKDKTHPFIVKSDEQEVEVLGTHFNIKAYTDEKFIKTTLLEGSVKVKTPVAAQILVPGEQARNLEGSLTVGQEDTEAVIAWKNGYFEFEESLEGIMSKISRWYNVEVEFVKGAPKDDKFWGYISRANKLSEVLRQLERTEKVRFEINGNKIKVLNNNQ